MKSEYLFGIHAVQALLEKSPQLIERIFILEQRQDKRLEFLITLAEQNNITLEYLTKDALNRLAPDAVHQGIIASFTPREVGNEVTLEDLLATLSQPPFLLILDGVQDPHNLGACLRTAEAAGVHAVITPKDRAVGLTPTVRKVASGAAESLPFIQVTNLARTLRFLREENIWLFGLADEGEGDFFAADFKGPLAFVLGAEGEGLRRLTREHCDVLLAIPMAGAVSSLNVSVAAGICLFEAVRQRR